MSIRLFCTYYVQILTNQCNQVFFRATSARPLGIFKNGTEFQLELAPEENLQDSSLLPWGRPLLIEAKLDIYVALQLLSGICPSSRTALTTYEFLQIDATVFVPG